MAEAPVRSPTAVAHSTDRSQVVSPDAGIVLTELLLPRLDITIAALAEGCADIINVGGKARLEASVGMTIRAIASKVCKMVCCNPTPKSVFSELKNNGIEVLFAASRDCESNKVFCLTPSLVFGLLMEHLPSAVTSAPFTPDIVEYADACALVKAAYKLPLHCLRTDEQRWEGTLALLQNFPPCHEKNKQAGAAIVEACFFPDGKPSKNFTWEAIFQALRVDKGPCTKENVDYLRAAKAEWDAASDKLKLPLAALLYALAFCGETFKKTCLELKGIVAGGTFVKEARRLKRLAYAQDVFTRMKTGRETLAIIMAGKVSKNKGKKKAGEEIESSQDKSPSPPSETGQDGSEGGRGVKRPRSDLEVELASMKRQLREAMAENRTLKGEISKLKADAARAV